MADYSPRPKRKERAYGSGAYGVSESDSLYKPGAHPPTLSTKPWDTLMGIATKIGKKIEPKLNKFLRGK